MSWKITPNGAVQKTGSTSIEKFKNKDYGDYMIIQLVPLERQVTDRGLNNGIR